MKKIVTLLLAGTTLCAIAACEPEKSNPLGVPKPHITVVPDATSKPGDPKESQYDSCVESRPPCVTYVKTEWRLVTSSQPYVTVRLVICGAEDGGPVLPCVLERRNRQTGKFVVFTES